jgi:hypothetical protein
MYFLHATSNDGPDADLDWVRRSEGKLFCKHCRTINRALYPQPIDVQLRSKPPTTWTYCSPFRVGITLYRRDFVEAIAKELTSGFVCGRCFLPDGAVLANYVTLYSQKHVLMRGDKQTRTEVCPLCSSVWSDLVIVFRGRPAYLLRHELDDARLFQGTSGDVFMRHSLTTEIDWSRFRDIRLRRIEVRDTPLDGRRLPGDPDWGELT